MSLINSSKIKKQIRDKGFRVSKDAFTQFERKIALTIDAAISAATADKRKTVQGTDVA